MPSSDLVNGEGATASQVFAEKKNANLSLVRTFKHGLRGELQAESKRGKNEWRGVRARGGREGEDGRGSGNSLLRWVANYCPF